MAEYTCIVCPMSCRITVTEGADGELTITGNTCKRGENHARNEHTHPMRMLTSTVRVRGGSLPRLPVVSSKEVPKALLNQCRKEVAQAVAVAPITCGDVIIHDVCGTGADILASRSLD